MYEKSIEQNIFRLHLLQGKKYIREAQSQILLND